MLMTQAIHLLVYFKVSIEYTSTHILQTVLIFSITLQVIRDLLLMMQVCSIAHTFHYRWFVQLERIPSSQKLDLRLATAWSQTHSLKDLLLVLVALRPTLTYTTDVYKLRTLCKRVAYILYRDSPSGGSFFYLNN